MTTLEQYQAAEREKAVRASRYDWKVHAIVYVAVNAGLIVLNTILVVFTDASFWWFPFPLFGWGIGLALHYLFGVRWAGREIDRRQAEIEGRAERLEKSA